MKHVQGFFLLAFLCAGVLDANGTCDTSENFLEQGKWYEYSYDVRAEAASVGTTDDTGDMQLNCRVKITHIDSCKYHFKVSECIFSSGGGKPDQKENWIDKRVLTDISLHPTVVTLIDGQVKEMKVSPEEPEHYLNIKRALISAFILKKSEVLNGRKGLHTDVHGTCPWQITPTEEGKARSVKDMLYCAYPSRPDLNFSPWSLFWNMSFIQYLINSSTECSYSTSSDLKSLEDITCHERHAIKLESTHNTATAVQTNIWYSVKLQNSGDAERTSEESTNLVTTDIVFKYTKTPDPHTQPPDWLERAQGMLSDLVETTRLEIRLYTITMFHEFVAWLRASPDVIPLIDSVLDCSFMPQEECSSLDKELAMSFLLDALVQSNTIATMRGFRFLVAKNKVSTPFLHFTLYSWTNLYILNDAYIGEIQEICKETDKKFCWLTLGGIIEKFGRNNPKKIEYRVPDSIADAITHMTNALGKDCSPSAHQFPESYQENDKLDYITTMIKSIGNVGELAHQVEHKVVRQLSHCAENNKLPIHMNVAAIEALHKMHPSHLVVSRLFEVLQNSSLPAEVRITAYRVLVSSPEGAKVGDEIVRFLEQEKSSQVTSFIASHLWTLLNKYQELKLEALHYDSAKTKVKLVESVEAALEDSDLKLDEMFTDNDRQSRHKEWSKFFELTFLPDVIKQFGARIERDEVFSSQSFFPHLFTNATLQLFGKAFSLLDVGVLMKGLDQYIGKVFRLKEGKWQINFETLSEVLEELIMVNVMNSPKSSELPVINHYDRLEHNLQELVKTLRSNQVFPYAVAYFRMLGIELDFLSLKEISNFIFNNLRVGYDGSVFEILKQGISYNATRVVRVIEAYHQVPTLMGLPLNWTTNATLIFSTRQGIKMENSLASSFSGYFHPSAALTFLNRMVLDFPSVTQVGVQANSSAYTSTQLNAQVHLGMENARITVKMPDRPQKMLELLRTNQMIKHNDYPDIEDWDIERVTVDWCLEDNIKKVTGVDICHFRSYANVTHLIKPWFLMAAWAKWSLILYPERSDASSFEVEVPVPNSVFDDKWELTFRAPGNDYKREARVKHFGIGNFEIDVPELPFIKIGLKTQPIDDHNPSTGIRTEGTFQIHPEERYSFTYHKEAKEEYRPVTVKVKNKVAKEKQISVNVLDQKVYLETPYNVYEASSVVHVQEAAIKGDYKISYRNKESNGNWLKGIVSPIFWEGSSHAWLRLQTNSRPPVMKSKNKHIVSSETHLTIPYSTIEVLTYALESKNRLQLQVNLTKVEKETGRLLIFSNFSYNYWKHHQKNALTKEIQLYNFTISHNSWALEIEDEYSDVEAIKKITITRDKMVPKDSGWGFFSTWWHPSTSHLFDHKGWNMALHSHLKTVLTTEPAPDGDSSRSEAESSELSEVASELKAVANHYLLADIKFLYPYNSNEENIHFNGTFLWTSENKFQKDFALTSSYHNLCLDSHSVTTNYKDFLKMQIAHNSSLTHTSTGTTAYYNLGFTSHRPDCPEIDFRHNISSHVLMFSSNISTTCKASKSPYPKDTVITIDSKSEAWDMLNYDLKQYFDFSPSGSESMNLTHSVGSVTVTGTWNLPHEYKKKVQFIPKGASEPSFKMDYVSHPRDFALNVIGPNDAKISVTGNKAVTHPTATYSISGNEVPEGVSTFTVSRMSQQDVLLSGWLNETLVKNYLWVIQNVLSQTKIGLTQVINDPNHPLNQILKPALKMPLGSYYSSLKAEVFQGLLETWMSTLEAVNTYEAFYKPSFQVVINAANEISAKSVQANEVFKRTIPGWAFYYFELPWVLKTAVQSPQVALSIAKMYLSHQLPQSKVAFSLTMPHPSTWKQILSDYLKHTKEDKTIDIKWSQKKIAAIFGAGHVLTFDGKFVEFPVYPDAYCTYLLSHHLHGNQFSVYSTKEDLLVIFPEVSIKIAGTGDIFLNGSGVPASVPYESKSRKVSLVRVGDIIQVESNGLSIHCDTPKAFCAFILDPLYHGSIAGILGNADSETHNDFMLPDGKVTYDVSQFARAYEMTGHPECRHLQERIQPHVSQQTKNICHRTPTSLQKCFSATRLGLVYKEACEFDVSNEIDKCVSSDSMAALCSYFGFKVETCNSCHGHYHPIKEENSDRHFHVRPAHRLEVAVVISEHNSLFAQDRASGLKGLKMLLDSIDTTFKAKGYGTILYSLISFSGKQVHQKPHVHTVSNKIFVLLEEMVGQFLRTLKFDGQEEVGSEESLDFVLNNVPFHPKATKVILLLTPHDSQVPREELDKLHHLIQQSGITLYTFSNYPTIFQGKKVFGVRADGLIFPQSKSGKDSYLDYPAKDGVQAKLTAATRGSLFHLTFVEAAEPQAFFDEVATEIMAKVGKEVQQCKSCVCEFGSWWHMISRCKVVTCEH